MPRFLQFVNTYLRAGINGVIIGKKDNSEFIKINPGMMIKSAGNTGRIRYFW